MHLESRGLAANTMALQSLTGYFRSHPLPRERLAQANRLIAEEHLRSLKAQKPFHAESVSASGKTYGAVNVT